MIKIRDAKVIGSLVSPVRQALVDALHSAKFCTARDLAVVLGYPADALYYHLRLLERSGLVIRHDPARTKPRTTIRYSLRSKPARLQYAFEDKANKKAIKRVVSSMLRQTWRSFSRATEKPARVSGPRRNLWAGSLIGWLTMAEIERINKSVKGILGIMDHASPKRKGVKLHSVTFAISPIAPRKRSPGR